MDAAMPFSKLDLDPEHIEAMHDAFRRVCDIRRCGAQTRRGSWCQSPAMPNGRCRLHGGKSPGAPRGNQNAFKHGGYSAETIEARRKIATLLRTMKALVERC
jgi:hypothetical protein